MRPFLLCFCIMLLGFGLSACISDVSSKGYVLDEEALNSIKPGESGRQDVFGALGSPSSSSDFEVERWHYIGKVVKSKSVLDPRLLEQEVVTVEFDKEGIVQSVQRKGKDDAQDIEVTDRETPTRGHSMGAIEQLIGNFGRFNQNRQDAAQ